MAVNGAQIVADARRYLGVPYLYGGTNPKIGMDCSGLVYVVCHDLGITSCPRTSEEQWAWVTKTSTPGTGDLVFFTGAESDPPPGHVGIVVTPGQMIDEPHTGTVCQTGSYQANGTGVNQLIGYGSIPGVSPSPTGSASTQPLPATTGAAAVVIGVLAGSGFGLVLLAVVLIPGAVLLYKAVRGSGTR